MMWEILATMLARSARDTASCDWTCVTDGNTGQRTTRMEESIVTSNPRPSKREAILQAMLDVVTERGLHDAPMSLVMERSGASAGVIYHHFASKDAILEALFHRIRGSKMESVLAFYSPEMEPREAFLRFGVNIYRFYRDHPREVRFLQQVEVAGLPCCAAGEPYSEVAAGFERCFRRQSEGGVLRDWPQAVLEEVTVGLVEHLAALPDDVSEEMLREVGLHIWEAVRAKDRL